MSGDGRIEEDFGGERRSFRVGLGELRRIQEACDAGPPVIAGRLARCVQVLRAMPKATVGDLALAGLGDWNVDDIREPVLQGLLGAGMAPTDAARLVVRWIDQRGFQGLIENAGLALALVIAGVDVPKDDPVSGGQAGAAKATTSRGKRSPSPSSTAPAPP